MKTPNTKSIVPTGAGLLLALAALQASPLQAAEYLLTPVSPRAMSARKLEALLRSGGAAVEVSPLFGAGEARALGALGDGKLASTLRVRTKSSAQDAALRRRALRAGWSADLNSRAELQETSSFESLQWGLHNAGDPQKLTLSETRTLMIPGKAGEDAGISRAPAPRADAAPVIVAVLDTGVDSTHPDLAGRIIRPPVDPDAPIPADSLSDDIGHGTHVAGVIAAQGQVTGVASSVARILPVKVIKRAPNAPIRPQDATPTVPTTPATQEGAFADDIARGLLYAVRHDARVINLSLAWPKAADAEVLRRMVQLARSRGVLIVSAAGNDASQAQVFPCAYDGVICVAAHGPDGALSHFSNYGAAADVAAPGLAILSTWPLRRQPSTFTAFQGYELKNGTSMAAPFVSGMLARLLAEGMSPAEARARLLTGVRPVQEPTWENEALLSRLRKWITRGNADLARALTLAPQPLIEAASKAPVALRWQPGVTRSLPLRLELRNAWADAPAALGATLRLLPFEGPAPQSPSALPARLGSASWSTASWKSGETRVIETTLEITDPSRLEARYLVDLSLGEQHVRIPLTLSRLMDTATRTGGAPGAAIAGAFTGAPLQLDESTDIRSVNPRDGRPELEFFAIRESVTGTEKDRKLDWRIQRMTRTSTDGRLLISVSAPASIVPGSAPASANEGLSLYQIDRLRAADGGTRYALVTLLGPATQGATPKVRITLLRKTSEDLLEVDQVIEHDNAVSALPETFRWMAMDGAAPRPAWIGAGTTPPLEKKPYNPWDPKPVDQPERRFYFLAADGIRSLAAPKTAAGKKQDWIALLQPSTEDLREGRIRALLASGEDYNVSYSVARIRNAQIEGTEALELSPFRMLDGIAQTGRVQALAPGHEGSFYSGAGTLGSLRTTLVYADASGTKAGTDLRQAPVSALDSAMSELGVFAGPSTLATFVETHSVLQFHDHRTGETAVTSLGRYSFLPTFIFSQSYFPLVSADGPSLLVPSELGTPDGVGVLRPVRDGSGALTLTRPARDQWESGDSCLRIGNPIRNPQGDRIAWLCSSGWWEVSF